MPESMRFFASLRMTNAGIRRVVGQPPRGDFEVGSWTKAPSYAGEMLTIVRLGNVDRRLRIWDVRYGISRGSLTAWSNCGGDDWFQFYIMPVGGQRAGRPV